MSTEVEYVAPDGQQVTVSDGPDENDGTTGTAEVELTQEQALARQITAMDAEGQAKAALAKAAESKDEDEVDPDEMRVVPNRQAMRDAIHSRGSFQPLRSRVRRRINRIKRKKGYWQ